MSADGLMGRPELLWRGQWGTVRLACQPNACIAGRPGCTPEAHGLRPHHASCGTMLCEYRFSPRPSALVFATPLQICCGDRFCFSNDGSVADRLCDTLQLPRPGRLVDGSLFGRGIGPVLLDKAYCRWSDYSFDECSFSINTAKCTHAQDVGLECAAPPSECLSLGACAALKSDPVVGRLVHG